MPLSLVHNEPHLQKHCCTSTGRHVRTSTTRRPFSITLSPRTSVRAAMSWETPSTTQTLLASRQLHTCGSRLALSISRHRVDNVGGRQGIRQDAPVAPWVAPKHPSGNPCHRLLVPQLHTHCFTSAPSYGGDILLGGGTGIDGDGMGIGTGTGTGIDGMPFCM